MAEAPNRIAHQDVLDAATVAIAELDAGFFRAQMNRTTDAQRAHLAATARWVPAPTAQGTSPERWGPGRQDYPRCVKPSSPAASAIPPPRRDRFHRASVDEFIRHID